MEKFEEQETENGAEKRRNDTILETNIFSG